MPPIAPIYRKASECLLLNESEQKIFSLLKECCRHYQLDVTLRVAGGWVRDKLLGLECQDCDITIDKMMGQSFAEKLCSFLHERNVPTSAYGVIQANPERSKHLETATLKIHGYPIDFVNLRSESYSEESRIPAVQFGTPLEDALRRDITINSLFYNLHSEMVEDFCATGLEDLNDMLIRTPLSPKETLLDDPLRLLRVIRFAARFQFRIERRLLEAISDEQVDDAFRAKISRERVGTELDKIFSDRHCWEGLSLMHQCRVFNLIFDVPAAARDAKLPTDNTVDRILRVLRDFCLPAAGLIAGYDRRLALLAAAILPHAAVLVDHRPGKKAELLSTMILRDSLKLTSHDVTEVNVLLSHADRALDLVCYQAQPDTVQTGRLVRGAGRHWQIAFHLGCIQSVLRGVREESADTYREFSDAMRSVHALGLDQAWSWRPVLSGRDVFECLGVREGRVVGDLLSAVLDWQYEHPQGSRDAAIAHIQRVYAEKSKDSP